MYEQIRIKISEEYTGNYTFVCIFSRVLLLVSFFMSIGIFLGILDGSIFEEHQGEDLIYIILSVPFMISCSFMEMNNYKMAMRHVEQFDTILVINHIMFRSVYLNKLNKCDTFIDWCDIYKIVVMDKLTGTYNFCEDHEHLFIYCLNIYLRNGTLIEMPYRLHDHTRRYNKNCTDVTCDKLYKSIKRKFSEQLSEYNIILEKG